MKMLAIVSLVAVLLLSACSPGKTSPDVGSVQTAIAQTQSASNNSVSTISVSATNTLVPTNTSVPTSTSTPVALDTIDLSTILIQPGDLPAGASGAQIRTEPPAMFDEMPVGVNHIYQQFEYSGKVAGGVSVFIYEDSEDIDKGYLFLLDGLGDEAQELKGVGEKAHVISTDIPGSTASGLGMNFSDLVFERCYAVVHIRMTFTGDIDAISAYAQSLDNRLKELVCTNDA